MPTSKHPTRAMALLFAVAMMMLAGCMSAPPKVPPVQTFELQRYLGTWYEIARLDNWFERGMNQVTANYSLRNDGGVEVRNRGFVTKDAEWEEAIGKAYPVVSPGVGHLKVSFFGPFYAHYVVFELDPDYQYAFVTSDDGDYLWLLSRTPTIPESL